MESWVASVIAELSEQFGPVLLAVGGLVAFAESALGLGFVFPGEWAVLTLGAATATPTELALTVGVVAVAASGGDHVGYLIGRRAGPSLRRSRLVRRVGLRHWDRGSLLLQRYGGLAVVVSRLLPAVRTLVPAAAGAGGLSYLRFAVGSVLGAVLWAVVWVGAGAAARTALPEVAAALGAAGWYALGGLVLLAVLAILVVRRLRRDRCEVAAE
ncbi:DedA family protein [Georgenia alba]|uniref:DedA family protein n=1 Tax=Georgenia alba TaxID=2233858 RepID=A0ABW2QC50_9MICO